MNLPLLKSWRSRKGAVGRPVLMIGTLFKLWRMREGARYRPVLMDFFLFKSWRVRRGAGCRPVPMNLSLQFILNTGKAVRIVLLAPIAALLMPVALAQASPPPVTAPVITAAPAQNGGNVLRTQSTLVLVPALVKTKKGEPVFTLTADRFVVTDDGVPQAIKVEEDTGDQPLALVVVVEIGGAGEGHLASYRGIGPLIEAMVGGVAAHVAVLGYDSQPGVELPFTTDMEKVGNTIDGLEGGDRGAATLDAVDYAVGMLKGQPPEYRRAILLLSETVDHGSKMNLEAALHAVTETNTAIYSIAFSSSGNEIKGSAAANLPHGSGDVEPGPPGGCMAQDPDKPVDPTYTRGQHAYDCAALLLPPLELVRAAAIVAKNGLKRNVPETISKLSGGEYFDTTKAKTMERDLGEIANHIPNRYMLSFTPASPRPGLHVLRVTMKDDPEFVVTSRGSYWADDDAAGAARR
jgi:VWFA-related protein